MARPALTADLRDGVLELRLDTPNSEVNVFSEPAANELGNILNELDFARVRALVIRSKKPGSFVNGVGLMMASAARDPEDVPRLSAGVRRAFRAVRALSIPTISAIQGNCYGCGVEFALHTRYRVAERTFDTHFYMTELADYLFLPVFGATQDLPRLLGLGAAADFLMWGERWSADEACKHGLVHASFTSDRFEAELDRFIEGVLRGEEPIARPAAGSNTAVVDLTRARIAALPEDYRELYATCLALMQRAVASGADYAAEIAASARSLLQPRAKSALSMFFVRQLARSTAVRNVVFEPVQRVAVSGDP
ncbi:MAG TPA: enoyl-CoA hydratase/isomerase family protein, partial [Polyangiaceae bacterium]|nr:enoyl-CoA hydratase/isomerase family protein [Polyangiaceae bacterium]